MNNFPIQQRGATLVITLVILVVVILLAVSSMRRAVLENRITGDVIEQARLQNIAEPGLCEGEQRSVSTPRPSESGTGCTADNVTRPCLLDPATLKLRSTDTYQNPIGALKGIANIWMSHHGSDITSAATVSTLCSMQWNNLPIPSGGQVDEAESPEYGNLMRGIGTFYYETNSVTCNQTNSEAVLQTTLTRLYTN